MSCHSFKQKLKNVFYIEYRTQTWTALTKMYVNAGDGGLKSAGHGDFDTETSTSTNQAVGVNTSHNCSKQPSRSPIKVLTSSDAVDLSCTLDDYCKTEIDLRSPSDTQLMSTAKSQFIIPKSVDLEGNYCIRDKKNQRYHSTNVNCRQSCC